MRDAGRRTQVFTTISSRISRFHPGILFHLTGPFQKSQEFEALAPHESPELQKADVVHLHARISLDAPAQIRTSPRREMMAACGVPEKSEDVEHRVQYSGTCASAASAQCERDLAALVGADELSGKPAVGGDFQIPHAAQNGESLTSRALSVSDVKGGDLSFADAEFECWRLFTE